MENNPFDALGNNDWEPSNEDSFIDKLLNNLKEDQDVTDHDIAIFVGRVSECSMHQLIISAVAFEIAYRELQATGMPPTKSLNEFLKLIGEYQHRAHGLEHKLRDDFVKAEDAKWVQNNPEKAAAREAKKKEEEEAQRKMIEALIGNARAGGGNPQSVGDIFGGEVMGLDMPDDADLDGPFLDHEPLSNYDEDGDTK